MTPCEWHGKFQDQENCAGDGQRADAESRDDGHVGWRTETEAREKYQYDEKRDRNRTFGRLRRQQPARLREIGPRCQRLRLQRALPVVLRWKRLNRPQYRFRSSANRGHA